MGSTAPRRRALAAVAAAKALAALAAFALVFSLAPPLHAAPKKKKKKQPPPPTATVEIDTPAPSPAAPPPSPAPAPPPEPASQPSAAAEPTPAPAHGAHHTPAYTSSSFAPLGAKHTLVFDDLSGFRASTVGGVAYVGPLGFSVQSFGENITTVSGANAGSDTIHETTFWFAPSADFFVLDHLSIGAVIEFAYTSSNYTQSVFGTATASHSLPSTTNVTILPRAGWMFGFGDHWGIWPRLGLGWGLVQANALTNAGTNTGTNGAVSSSSTFLVDVDVGVLYRIDPRWFLRAAPEFTLGPGAGIVSFSVGAGFGYMWNL